MRRLGAVVLGALLLGGACSSSGTTAQADACQFVSEGDVSASFGFPVTRDGALSAQSHQCVFHRTSTNASETLDLVAVNVAKGQDAINAYKAIIGDPSVTVVDSGGAPSSLSAHEVVTGLGDGAVWQPDVTQLVVIKGSTRLDVILGGPDKNNETAATNLARSILPRLT